MKKTAVLIALLTGALTLNAGQDQRVKNDSPLPEKQFFIENKGQWPQYVLFLSQTGGMDVWITKQGIVYDFYQLTPLTQPELGATPEKKAIEYSRKGQVVQWKYNGSSVTSSAEGKGKKSAYYNYFIGNNPAGWATNVGLYEEVIVKNAFKDIDARYYFDKGNIRYDYIVHPGADVNAISLSAKGTDQIYINNGDLMTQNRFGDVSHGKLFAYQTVNGLKKEVSCEFVVKDKTVAFTIGAYDKNIELVIDPLVWGTFIGGTIEEGASGMTLDASNNVYLTGSVYSTNYPTTTGVYDLTQNGNQDAYLTKLSANGNALVFSSFLGGSGSGLEQGYSVAVDVNGNAYVTGNIGSVDFPTTVGAFDVSASGTDAFVTKFNSLGNVLIYSTYLGGSSQDYGLSITTDASFNAYVTGYTNSTTFPVTTGVFDPNYTGNGLTQDVFVTKLNPTGSALVFSTFLGGNGSDYANSIAVDGSGNVYVTGSCSNAFPLFPATFGSYDDTQNGGDDVFVTKFNPTATALVFSTFIGGTTNDAGLSIALDASNNIFIAGHTASTTYPVTVGVFDQTHNGGVRDAFITKLNAAGNALMFSTFVGGTGDDRAHSLAINSSGVVYFCGITVSADFPTTSGAFDQTSNGGWDGYVAQLNSTGSALGYSSYYGGTGNDYINIIRHDGSGSVVIAGGVSSTDLPTTTGAYDQTYNGGTYDVAVAKFCTPPTITATANTPLCFGQTLNLTTISGNSYSWSGPNSFSSSLQNPSITNVSAANSGTYSVTVTTSGGCSGTATVNVVISSPPVAVAGSNSPVCAGQTLNLSASGGVSYSWSGPNSFSSSLQNPSITNATTTASGTYTVTVTGSGGCTTTATVNVTVNSLPTVLATSDAPVCVGDMFNLNANGAASYSWTGPNSFASSLQNPSVSNATSANAGIYTVVGTGANGCVSTATVSVTIFSLPVVTTSSNSPLCAGQTLNLQSSGGVTYSWSGPDNFSSSQQNTSVSNTALINVGTYTVTVTNGNGCVNTGTTTVVINALPAISTGSNSPVCDGQSVNFTSGGGTTYVWSGPNNFSSTSQNPVISNATVNDAGVYTVVVTDANGCVDSSSLTITVNALPNVTAGSNSPVCLGQAIAFTSSGGNSYSWSGPGNFSTTQQNPSIGVSTIFDAGTYFVTVTDVNGCVNTASVTVTVIDVNVNITSNSPLCNGDALSLTAGGGANYSWSGPNNFSSNAQNPSINSVTANSAGAYTVTVTDANGCSDTASVYVQVNTVNSAATANGAVLTAAANGATYQWIDCSNNAAITGATSQTYTATQNGQYAVIVTENGCTDTSACLTVSSVGISENAVINDVTVYPNPVISELFIVSASPVQQVMVYSASGALIICKKSASMQSVNVGELATGIYYIEIVTEQGIARQKFLKD